MKNKRIFYLYGGLGNQIFQINSALTRRIEFGESITIDTGLNKGKISNVFDKSKIKSLGIDIVNSPFSSKIILLLSKFSFFRNLFSISNDKDKYYRKFNVGYWQNASLFKKQYVEKVLSFSINLPVPNTLLLHLRVGDYLVGKNSDIYNELDSNFYLDSINFVFEKKKINFINIFSNDKERALEIHNLIASFCSSLDYGVDITIDNSQSDLDLFIQMLGCDNFIIANSSLSLAASLLCLESDSLKIGPRKWFKKNIFPYKILNYDFVQF